MSPETPRVTEAELAVLTELWRAGPPGCTVRAITDALYPPSSPAQIATVQKLLERLESKGCVTRRREGRAHRFAAIVDRDALIRSRLDAVAADLCQGSLTPLLTHLVSRVRLEESELSALRQLLDGAEEPPADSGGSR